MDRRAECRACGAQARRLAGGHSASGHSGAAPICGLANLMFYKFLHTEDIDRVLRESTLKVSSLKYFRDLEDKQDPAVDAVPESIIIKIPDTKKHFHELFRDYRA